MNTEYHNPDGLTDEQVGVKDGWRLCLKTEREHQGCEWFGPASNNWYQHDGGNSLSPFITYRTRRPLPESSTEPKEGGETCAHKVSETPNVSSSTPLPSSESLRINPGASNAAAGTSNPDQQAASVQLPWIEQQQRDREALAAETDQAPPQAWVLFGREDEVERCDYARVPVGDRAALLHAVKAAVWDMPENANEEEAQHITDRLIAEGIYRFEGDPALELETVPPYSMPTAPAVAEQELLPCPFCGTEPISRWVGVSVPGMEDCGYHAVECPKCVGSGGVPFCGVHADLREDAEKQWNRRPAAPVAETPLDCEQKGAEA